MEQTLGVSQETVSDGGRELRCARQMIAAKRSELGRADAMASGVLAAACALPVSPLASLGDRLLPGPTGRPAWWCWGTGCGLWVLAVATLLFALMPIPRRYPTDSHYPTGSHYPTDGQKPPPTGTHPRAGEIHRALRHAAVAPLEAALGELSWTNGAVIRKHTRIRLGLVLLAVATTLLFLGSL